MKLTASQDFDFDSWSKLAGENAAEFERQRLMLIEDALATAPAHMQQRLRGLQFRIDLERQRAGTFLGAAVRLNSLMWSSFMELRDGLTGLSEGVKSSPAAPLATLIPFSKRP